MFTISIKAGADTGSKDNLIIYVKNPPSEPYYLDLLTKNSGAYNGYYERNRETLDQEMIESLYSYKNEGWTPALAGGTELPMSGELTGKQTGNQMIHRFGYYGLPDTYRIIIVTESGKVSASDICTRVALQSSVTYDYASGKVTVPPVFLTYLFQFAVTFILTIVFEGIVLLIFRINLKENWKVFLIVNFITQIILTLTVGAALVNGGSNSAYSLQPLIEILILAGEAIAYRFFLTGTGNKRKVAYAVVANLTSWIIGIIWVNISSALSYYF